MRIGLIDVDGHNFPSLPLMKISAWHKQQGDSVEWYNPLTAWYDPPDRVYMSKVFTFTSDYPHPVNAGEVIKGGTGYNYPEGKPDLPLEIEHIYPDYSLYPALTKDTAYGFLTRGCPRGCGFCIVKSKEGLKSRKVADLSEFWDGQKNIVLLDPNFFACREWKGLSQQLIDSKAWIDFSQGCDIRIMTKEKIETLKQIKIKQIHFAWDRYGDKEAIVPKFREFKQATDWDYRRLGVYVLTNFDTTIEQDLERIYILRELGYSPYVMIFDKEHVPKGHILRRLQRWVNSRVAFQAVERFEDFKRGDEMINGEAAYEQMDIFSYLQPQQKSFEPGEWVEKNVLGKQLTFDEVVQEVGNLIVIDRSTESHEWYKVVRVEKIILVEEGRQRRLVYYDGEKQRGFVNEMYFDENMPYPEGAYRLAI